MRIGKVETKFGEFRPFTSKLQAQFQLGQNHLEVSSLEWSSGRSHIEAAGRVDDLSQPKLEGTYNARIDLAELASVTRREELAGGTIELAGKGRYSARDFATAGKIVIRDFDWHDQRVDLRNASLSTQYDASPAHLKLSGLQAHLLGGSAAGDVDVVNSLNSAPPSTKAKTRVAAEQRGTVNLRLKDISVSALATAFATKKLPLNRLKFVGSGGGTIAARWKGSPENADASFAFEIVSPEKLSAGEIPISARTTVWIA